MSFGRRPKSEEPVTAEAARLKAMRLLARREHSARQLSGKLRAGGVEAEAATELVQALAEDGWQSDDRFADALARNRVAQGFGPLRIRAELAMAGVEKHRISEVLEALQVDWFALCASTRSRKFGDAPADREARNRQWRSLAQKGFDGAQIKAAISADAVDDFAEPDADSE